MTKILNSDSPLKNKEKNVQAKILNSNSPLKNKEKNVQAKILAQGAEAIISLEKGIIIKKRVPKSYRLKELDEKLRESRTRKEKKILEKAHKIINVPEIIGKNERLDLMKIIKNPEKVLEKIKYEIKMEYIEGDKLAEKLNSYPQEKQLEVMEKLGEEVAKLHANDIIHGDLTTSNTIYVENKEEEEENNEGEIPSDNKTDNYQRLGVGFRRSRKIGENTMEFRDKKNGEKFSGKVYIIDFGLGFISKRTEDKAVDLHLIKQALEAKHFQNYEKLFRHFKEGYKKDFKDAEQILERFKKVEVRGRYKHAE
jgi:Kae1-associated kinase Bud32